VRYAFFPGCAYHAAAGYKESVDALNKAIGLDFVELPDWNCCGATTYFGMDKWKAVALTGRLLALAQAQGFEEIVTVCNACFSTLRKANEWFIAHPENLREVNSCLREENLHIDGPIKVRHYLDVLVHDVPENTWARNKGTDLSGVSVAGYYGCQLNRPWNDLGDPEHPTILEDFIQMLGFTPVEHSAKTRCCGAAHAVAYVKDCRPLIGRIIGEVHGKGAHMVATVCPLCQFNLDAGQSGLRLPRVPVPYFSQLAGLALNLDRESLGLKKLLVPLSGI
jgi:heterodisulfide reductase subunit B